MKLRENSSIAGIGGESGFTLVELLVSISLFAVVMMISVGTLLSLVDANRQSQSLKSVTNNLNFALDTMTRTIRTGFDYSCGSASVSAADCQSGDTILSFYDDHGCHVTYEFIPGSGNTEGYMERSVDDGLSNNCPNETGQRLTAPEVDIEEMQFYVTGTNPGIDGDTVQPTVTMVLRGRAGAQTGSESTFNIQTTVTQRLLDN